LRPFPLEGQVGLKLVFQMTLMTMGLYNEPTGAVGMG
jgi:hypothetical protein